VRPLRFLSLLLLLVTTLAASALEVPPPPKRWVTDSAGVLSLTALSTLDTKLENFEQTSGAQFLIYTFKSLEGESVEDFTQRCVAAWKVGQAKYDNGLVLFVFVAERKVRVEVGYGLEGSITDAFSSRVIREQIAPQFQKNDYGAGLSAAADAIMAKIRTGEEPVAPLNPRGAQQGQDGVETEGGATIGTLVFLAIIFIFFILPMLRRRGRGRSSGCGGCILPFFLGGGGSGITFGGGGFGGGGFGGGGGGGGGFSGGGGSFGGGGATGGW
jgi:uncharacterized protein